MPYSDLKSLFGYSGARSLGSAVVTMFFIVWMATSASGQDGPGSHLAPPYPESRVITDLTWGALVTRQATGSDNWPVAWADDDHLYTAYGDGWGFEPKVDPKLSMGFARVEGTPQTTIKGYNIRSPDEQKGDGRSGKKACGILSIDGTLYLWARNADNQGRQVQIAKSTNRAKTWTWGFQFAPFSHTDFIDFGRDYAGARDSYVYAVTVDGPDAYRPADRYCLMRVPKDEVMTRSAYEFFVDTDDEGNPIWTSDIDDRGAVFSFPGNCYRHGISYNEALDRYLWLQLILTTNDEDDVGDHRGIAVYEAPEPWGPWRTVFFDPGWHGDAERTLDRGEFPTKWMGPDGRTLHLIYSGEDSFKVQKAKLTVSDDGQ